MNKMKDIAKLFNKELNEEFFIINEGFIHKGKFTENGFYFGIRFLEPHKPSTYIFHESSNKLYDLLMNRIQISPTINTIANNNWFNSIENKSVNM